MGLLSHMIPDHLDMGGLGLGSVVRRCECGRLLIFYCGPVIKSRLVQSAAGAAGTGRGWMNLLKKSSVT